MNISPNVTSPRIAGEQRGEMDDKHSSKKKRGKQTPIIFLPHIYVLQSEQILLLYSELFFCHALSFLYSEDWTFTIHYS